MSLQLPLLVCQTADSAISFERPKKLTKKERAYRHTVRERYDNPTPARIFGSHP